MGGVEGVLSAGSNGFAGHKIRRTGGRRRYREHPQCGHVEAEIAREPASIILDPGAGHRLLVIEPAVESIEQALADSLLGDDGS
jgi:hypothetical protein